MRSRPNLLTHCGAEHGGLWPMRHPRGRAHPQREGMRSAGKRMEGDVGQHRAL